MCNSLQNTSAIYVANCKDSDLDLTSQIQKPHSKATLRHNNRNRHTSLASTTSLASDTHHSQAPRCLANVILQTDTMIACMLFLHCLHLLGIGSGNLATVFTLSFRSCGLGHACTSCSVHWLQQHTSELRSHWTECAIINRRSGESIWRLQQPHVTDSHACWVDQTACVQRCARQQRLLRCNRVYADGASCDFDISGAAH